MILVTSQENQCPQPGMLEEGNVESPFKVLMMMPPQGRLSLIFWRMMGATLRVAEGNIIFTTPSHQELFTIWLFDDRVGCSLVDVGRKPHQ